MMTEENRITDYMRHIIQDICETIGPRPPCSPKEAQCAAYINAELKKFTNKTKIEEFQCHPQSYRIQYQIPSLSMIGVTFLYWLYFFYLHIAFLILPLLLLVGALLVIQLNIMRNSEFIDPLFPKQGSTNVFGIISPKGEVTARIVIGGHHDSNWEYPVLRKSWRIFGFLTALPIISNYLFFGLFVLKLIVFALSMPYIGIREVDLTLLIILTSLIPVLLIWMFNIVSHRPVMGANDNLTAIAILLAIGSYLKNAELKRTEIWLVSHGCEEIGDRGSKAFAKTHYNDLKNALVINLDMVGGQDSMLRFITTELMFMFKLSPRLLNELVKITEELQIPYQTGLVEGFTDSLAYIQNKIEACSITGFPPKGIPAHYHTREDTMEHLNFENLWQCYRILLRFIEKVDEGEILPNKKISGV